MVFLGLATALIMVPPDVAAKTDLARPNAATPMQKETVSRNSPSTGTSTVSPVTAAAAFEPDDPSRTIELSLGTSLATGKFGSAARSSIWSTAFGARATLGGLRLSASIPYMRVRSNGTIFTGIDSTPIIVAPGGDGPKRINNGLGDVTVGASYVLPRQVAGLEIEAAGRVKIPTATHDSRLSTGQADYSFGLQATKVIGQFAPFVSANYRVLGDLNTFDLRNGFAASAGTSFIIDRRTVIIGSYHYAETASRFVRDSHELFIGGSRELSGGKLRLTGFGTICLSNGAAASSGGIAVSVAI